MGHSHFFIPNKIFAEKYFKIPTSLKHEMYEAFMKDTSIKVLYHTVEQLKMTTGSGSTEKLIADRPLLWRYFSRNLIGDNFGGENLEIHYAGHEEFNTIRDLEGYRYWGGGFYINANKNGCFPYKNKGETFYFDLSFESLPYEQSGDFEDL